jgi:HSP20 family protein
MLITRKLTGLAFPDLAELSWFPFVEPAIRIEEYQKDDRYIVRAELPGIDPAKDVEVTAQDGHLRLVVSRQEESKDPGRSEFRYGTFHRTVALPPGAIEDTILATYAEGILQITMKIGEPKPIGKHIPIAISHGNGQPKPVKKG